MCTCIYQVSPCIICDGILNIAMLEFKSIRITLLYSNNWSNVMAHNIIALTCGKRRKPVVVVVYGHVGIHVNSK